jgi:hypothetical protein
MHAWYGRPALLMTGFVLLSVAASGIAKTAYSGAYWSPVLLPAVVVLAWLVCRGSQIARMLLLIASWVGFLGAALDTAQWWDAQVFALLLIEAGMLALLLSPAVYLRTRNVGRIVGWPDAVPARLLGERWRLAVLGAPLLGLGLTFAWLGHPTSLRSRLGYPAIHGPWGRGYPLPVDHGLTETAAIGGPIWHLHGALITSWASFGRDYVQWTLASLVLFAVLWLWFQRRPALPGAPTQLTGSAVSPSGLAPRG